jgi:hypothetical protein
MRVVGESLYPASELELAGGVTLSNCLILSKLM